MSIKQVEEWVSSDEIIVEGEERVFEVIVRSFEGNERNKQEKFVDLFRHVRCVYVPRDYVFNVMLPHPLVQENLECSTLVLDTMKMAFSGSQECFFAQPPRNCLKTHEDAIVIIGPLRTLCYLPSKGGQKKWHKVDEKYRGEVHSISACHGSLYVGCNHDDVQRYDPTLNVWAPIKSPGNVTQNSAVVTLQGFLYVVGGIDEDGRQLSMVQKYNPDTNMWQVMPSLSIPKSCVCAVADGSFLYAIGGINAILQNLDIVERFDPKNNTWDKLPSTLSRRAGAGGAVIKQKVFVFGGLESQSTADPCEMYDPATNMWTGIPSLVAPRGPASAVSFKGKIYVFGGFQNKQNRRVKSLQVYDADNNKWESCTYVNPSFLSEQSKISCVRISKSTLAKCPTI